MSEWMIREGGYPYFEGTALPGACMTEPYPLMFWRGSGTGYPHNAMIPEMTDTLGCFANAVYLHTVIFDGTAAQFAAVSCGDQWRMGAPFDRVQCSDGEVLL